MAPAQIRLQDESRYLYTRRRILELMIDEKYAEEKIRELEINVTTRQVDSAIEEIKQDNGWTHEDLLAGLKRKGITYEEYRGNIKRDMERYRLINSQVKSKILIREEQIAEYYEKHKADYSTDETVHLAHIFLIRKNPKDENEKRVLSLKGESILERLRNGEDFGDLAGEFSQGPGAKEGGDLGVFKTAQLDPVLRSVLEDMPDGGFSALIVRPNGIQVIKLIERRKGKVKPLEEVRAAIYAILYQEEVNRRYLSWMGELRKEAYTKIIF
jgi:peptidyl-prolyl cis-trans isomerase SurA